MKTLQQKRLELLDETANHYNINNRCMKPGTNACYYSPKSAKIEGKTEGCAIGRKLSPELALQLDNVECFDTGVDQSEVFYLLPDNLKELGQHFLSSIQELHDYARFWTETGLSNEGLEKYNEIKESFC